MNLPTDIRDRLQSNYAGPAALIREDREMVLVRRRDLHAALICITELDLLATQLGALAKDKDTDRLYFRDQANAARECLEYIRTMANKVLGEAAAK